MRQMGKHFLTFATLLLLAFPVRAAGLVSTIVTDPLTGVAIDGYDPVSYFTDASPQQGVPDFEYDWGGVPWYFENAANRDAFTRHPEVYAPQFGGHCLMSLSRGFLSDGRPQLFAVYGQRLYLFYSAANREAFLLSKRHAVEVAEGNWPRLSAALSGPDTAIISATAGATVAPATPAGNLPTN